MSNPTPYVLVPREPSEAMIEAARGECINLERADDPSYQPVEVWRAMVAASAPTPTLGLDDLREEVARAIASADGVGQPMGYLPSGRAMRAATWEEFMPEQHEQWGSMADAVLAIPSIAALIRERDEGAGSVIATTPATIFALTERAEKAEARLHSVQKERDEARAGLAYVLDRAVYGNSYGVPGSDFSACHFCQGGGAPGVDLVHDKDCPVSRYPKAVSEWFDEMEACRTDAEAAESENRRASQTNNRDDHHAYRLAKAVQALRNSPMLRQMTRLRSSAEYADLCAAWERYNDDRQAAQPSEPHEAPGHTDMMIAPENLDAWLENNPLPQEDNP